jgi:uroporphyrinogen-III synthase
MQVLITRAKEQTASLEMICNGLALKPVLLPCVEIRPDIKNNSFTQAIHKFPEADVVIVVSANAAKIAVPHWPEDGKQPTILAIGPATAEQVNNLGAKVGLIANPPSSEGLLSLPLLQAEQVNNKKIIIFCGRNPKPLLKETLEAHGASVRLAYCYERICPVPLTKEAWQSKVSIIEPLVTISTSSALLENLVFMVPKDYLRLLESLPLIVISKSMENTAKSLGFSYVIRSDDATVDMIKQTLIGLLKGEQ